MTEEAAPRPPAAPSVLIADDHRMVLDIFSMFLTATAGMSVQTATDLDGALELVRAHGHFDVVLLDLNMPGMNGVTGLRRMMRANGNHPVGIITANPTPRMAEELLNAGAAGIVLKTTPVRSLANAIRFMQSGERYLPLELMRSQAEAQRQSDGVLSEKEMLVLQHLAEGKPNKSIATAVGLAEPTVKMHVTAICKKLSAQNRTQAVVVARNMGLV
ncbi:response regulator transcription factor [Frigidibacter oleivorans]|uniref:response regulator transcription factor n=1 Tax=Frigidibacter oleivorans TaxID=2487129 RepID=UPI000F8D4D7F|nr:response regulator transcription factor [Frigidibacter oleivorans]